MIVARKKLGLIVLSLVERLSQLLYTVCMYTAPGRVKYRARSSTNRKSREGS